MDTAQNGWEKVRDVFGTSGSKPAVWLQAFKGPVSPGTYTHRLVAVDNKGNQMLMPIAPAMDETYATKNDAMQAPMLPEGVREQTVLFNSLIPTSRGSKGIPTTTTVAISLRCDGETELKGLPSEKAMARLIQIGRDVQAQDATAPQGEDALREALKQALHTSGARSAVNEGLTRIYLDRAGAVDMQRELGRCDNERVQKQARTR